LPGLLLEAIFAARSSLRLFKELVKMLASLFPISSKPLPFKTLILKKLDLCLQLGHYLIKLPFLCRNLIMQGAFFVLNFCDLIFQSNNLTLECSFLGIKVIRGLSAQILKDLNFLFERLDAVIFILNNSKKLYLA
jgi:hypothetical protein